MTADREPTDKLIQQAYDEMMLRILADLDMRIQQRKLWIREADEETEDFWLRLRGRGVPDRHAELAAYQRLYAEIREVDSKEKVLTAKAGEFGYLEGK